MAQPSRARTVLATLDDVSIDIAVVLGRTAMPIHQVLRLGGGDVIELDSTEEDDVHILAITCQWRAERSSSAVIASLWKSSSCCRERPRRSKLPLAAGLVRCKPSCYIRAGVAPFSARFTHHAVVAELVDALA